MSARVAWRIRIALLVSGLTGLAGSYGRAAPAAAVNPVARLKVARSTTLWKSPDGKVAARLARFSPDGHWLAWVLGNGIGIVSIEAEQLKGNGTISLGEGTTVHDMAWGPDGTIAVCVRGLKGDRISGGVLICQSDMTRVEGVDCAGGADRVAWRDDGKALAFANKSSLFHHDFATRQTVELIDARKGWRPSGAPAFEEMVFVGDKVAAREAGSMKWWLTEPGKEAVALGEYRGLCPDPQREALYAVPWRAGPVRIPRGAGVVRLHPWGERLADKEIVPSDHATGKPYWLVDISDAEYPTALRVSPDGKTLTFCGVKAGNLASNPWREFCIWQVPSDGGREPEAVAACGPIFKRIDVGRDYFIGWRHAIDGATVLGDLKHGKAWRLPGDFDVQRCNTDVLIDKLLIAAARGAEVVLMQLAEERR